MRDILFVLLLVLALPLCIARADLAIAFWYWASLFQPQTQSYGFARDIPFGFLSGALFLATLPFRRGPKLPPVSPLTALLIALGVWTGITTFEAAVSFDLAYERWNLFLRLLLMVLFGIAVIRTRKAIDVLVWTICISLGYYGFKVGLFALRGGSGASYYGPSYMGGNNEVARGILLSLPLLVYLFSHYKQVWVRAGLAAVAASSVVGLVMSGSRGAWVAAIGMLCFTATRIRRGLLWFAVAFTMIVASAQLLPKAIVDRFLTISDYQNDASFQGRVGSWKYALDRFADRPLMGGGFGVFEFEHDKASHNSFFQALGEHGIVGLVLYLLLLITAFAMIVTIRKAAAKQSGLIWAGDLSKALQVCLVGYVIGSITINFAFFPGFYALLGILASVYGCVRSFSQSRSSTLEITLSEKDRGGIQSPGIAIPASTMHNFQHNRHC